MGELLGLSWDNYRDSMTGNLKTIIRDEDFVDVSLHCEGRTLRAHKVTTSSVIFAMKIIRRCCSGAHRQCSQLR